MIKFRFIKIDKKILAFILPFFCLLLNVSYASEFVAGTSYSSPINPSNRTTSLSKFSDDYTLSEGSLIINNYINDKNTYSSEFNNLVNSTMTFNNFDRYVVFSYEYSGKYQNYCYFWNSTVNDIARVGWYLAFSPYSEFIQYYSNPDSSELKSLTITGSGLKQLAPGYYTNFTFLESNSAIKYCQYQDSTGKYVWDGSTYSYEPPSIEEPDTPLMPTNAEIAHVVQSFYDSDLYKNNTNFKDFMVVYNFATGYYNIIGTDNHLLQEIYYDGAKPSNDDFTYPETWWRFYNYFGNVQNLFYGWDYWLYDTRKENDVFLPIKYDGVGKINNLFKLKFTSQSIIVYSSYDYDVYEFYPPITEGGENQVNETTVPGDEYTYNETLDPTDSKYSPIQNYIPVNPSQTIISDVDVSEINKTFEENKGILNIENASWLFTANNKLIGYFIGFLSLLIVFLIISRALGG